MEQTGQIEQIGKSGQTESDPKKPKAKAKDTDKQKQEALPVMTFGSVMDVFAFSRKRTVVKTGAVKYKVLIDPDADMWQECEVNPIKKGKNK
jgi:hypothetical protein